jgi:hypothetical protein
VPVPAPRELEDVLLVDRAHILVITHQPRVPLLPHPSAIHSADHRRDFLQKLISPIGQIRLKHCCGTGSAFVRVEWIRIQMRCCGSKMILSDPDPTFQLVSDPT